MENEQVEMITTGGAGHPAIAEQPQERTAE